MKNDGFQDPKLKLFKYISLWKEVVVLRLSCFLFVFGNTPRVMVLSWSPGSDVLEAAGSFGSCLLYD